MPFKAPAILVPGLFAALGSCQSISPVDNGKNLSIHPERTISFETTEGTGINLDLSPDGRTIVFDLLGDLYVVPTRGGVALQLTRGLGVDRRPVWSLDGKHIAYISDATGAETIWIVNSNGSDPHPIAEERPVFHGDGFAGVTSYNSSFTEVEWMPDGTNVVSDDTLYNWAGIARPKSLGLKSKYARSSRGGKYLYFVGGDRSTSGGILRYNTKGGIRRYDLKTGQTSDIAPELTNVGELAVSPDNRWLTYVREDALWVRDLATRQDRRIVFPLNFDFGRAAFSSDSRVIIASYNGKLHRIEIDSGRDIIIPFAARVKVDAGRFIYHQHRVKNDSLVVRYFRAPDVSPDGKTLVFSALQKLYMSALPTGEPKRLVPEDVGQFQPAYSPDGQWIAYVTWNEKDGGTVWRIPAIGGRPERLTSVAGYYQRPTWSPDGAWLAVLKGADGKIEPSDREAGTMQLLPSTGGTPRTIADSVWRSTWPTFTRDSKGLLFLRQESAGDDFFESTHSTLHSVRIEGGKDEVVARIVTEEDPRTSAIMPSPDGRYIAFCVDRWLYLTRVSGEKPQQLDETRAIPLAYGALDTRWSSDGRTLRWVIANRIFSKDPDRVFAVNLGASRPHHALIFPDDSVGVQFTIPRKTGNGIIALEGARAITINGNEVIDDATVVITNDRITAIGPRSTVTVPAGATTFDVQGKTIIPGFVDLHMHFGPQDDEDFAPQRWKYSTNLAYGVTTAREGNAAIPLFGDAELIESGEMVGPRVFNAGPAIHSVASLDDARAVVNHRKALGAVVVKQYAVRPRRERQWVARAADEAGLNVMVHADQAPIDLLQDGETTIEHEHRFPFEDMTRFWVASGSWLTSTFVTRDPTRRMALRRTDSLQVEKYLRSVPARISRSRNWDRQANPPGLEARFKPQFAEAAKIAQRGGNVTIGSHGDDQGIGFHWEMWTLQSGGLGNLETLRAATLKGAQGLGMQADLGSLEVGKIADLLILDKNPLTRIENTLTIRMVMKNGVLYDANALGQIWPRSGEPGPAGSMR